MRRNLKIDTVWRCRTLNMNLKVLWQVRWRQRCLRNANYILTNESQSYRKILGNFIKKFMNISDFQFSGCIFLNLKLTTTNIQWLWSAYPVGTSSTSNSQLSPHEGKRPSSKKKCVFLLNSRWNTDLWNLLLLHNKLCG